MKINFKTPLLDAENNPIPEKDKAGADVTVDGLPKHILLGKILADVVMGSANKENPMKLFEWALKMNGESGEIDFDTADQEFFKRYIKDHEGLSVLAKGRTLELFSKKEVTKS